MTKLFFSVRSDVKRSILLMLFAWIGSIYLSGQYTIRYPEDIRDIELKLPLITDVIDSVQVYKHLIDLQGRLHEKGYLSAGIDSIIWKEGIAKPVFFVGGKYLLQKLIFQKEEENYLKKFDRLSNDLEGRVYNKMALLKYQEEVLRDLQKTGYPFASVSIDSFMIKKGLVEGFVRLQRNEKVYYDTIRQADNPVVSTGYLRNLLDFKLGAPYNEEAVEQTENKIRDTRFMKLRSPPSVTFVKDKAYLNLDLEPRNSSRFDFLIGLQPNSSNEDGLSIIYDGTVEMINKLKQGERILFSLKSLRPETIELNLKLNYPYILSTPFGLDVDFGIYRNAEQFLELDGRIGGQYLRTPNNSISAYWKFDSSRLLDVDTSVISNLGRLPNQLDVSFNGFGLRWQYNSLDYRFNPRSGFYLDNDFTVGFKSIIENLNISQIRNSGVDFSMAYDSLNTNAVQLKFVSEIQYFVPLGRRSAIKLGVKSGGLFSENEIYTNEYFRIGGNQFLRGFDEESLFAEIYSILTTEVRLLIGPNSYISAFMDYGVYNNPGFEDPWDTPLGFGGGLSFETKVGIFGLSTAVGNDRNSDFDFGNAKVHFGFLSLF